MKRLAFAALAAIGTLVHPVLSQAAAPAATMNKFDIDPAHTHVGFEVRHMVVGRVHGSFHDVSGQLSWDDKDVAKSAIEVTINTATIDTGVQKRDEDLRSTTFLDVAKFPKMTFKSTKVEKSGKDLKVTGELTLHGVTKPVVLTVEGPAAPFKDPFGMSRTALTATGKLDRREFGLTFDKKIETGGLMVGDEVEIKIDAELVRKEAPKT